MTRRVCDRCSDDAEGPGSVVLRLITGQLPERRPRLDLCPACYARLERFLAPVGPPVRPHVDDQADDVEED